MKQIRANIEQTENEYQDFLSFFKSDGEKTTLKISSETDYVAFLNGKEIGYGQYEDLADYKVYDEYDITDKLIKGENVLAVTAFFEHAENSHYTEKGCALAFEVVCGGKTVCESCEKTLSRKSRTYVGGTEIPFITGQLGYAYKYDFRKSDDWITGGNAGDFSKSVVLAGEVKLFPRPIKKLVEKRNTAYIIRSGEYTFDDKLLTAAEKMYRAEISEKAENFCLPSLDGAEVGGGKNIYLLADLKDEITGILTFDIEVPGDCYMAVGYGEHISDGRVRSYIGGRNFQFEFLLRKGRNRFTGPFRRLGMRYMSLFLDSPRAKVYDFNVISTDYPATEKKKKIADERLREIYDVSVKTLRVCMHEHYEDTPWREQSLYAMDSRNQMLCGYYAFEGFEFPRASLKLMSQNMRPDRVFTLTTPHLRGGTDTNIPCFSLIQFCAMEEYINYSGDTSLISEYEENYRKVLEKFISLRCENGLIKPLKGYWNFYEWSDELDHGSFFAGEQAPDRYDAPLNAFFIMAVRSMINMLKKISRYNGEYDSVSETSVSALDKFFDETKNCYADFMSADGKLYHYSELTNSLCALVSKNKARVAAAANIIKTPSDLVKITLSYSIFKYEALMNQGKKNRDFIINDIKRVWGRMLDEGASTFYEDEQGDKAFGDAGSLSHGWSAVPVYVLNKLGY